MDSAVLPWLGSSADWSVFRTIVGVVVVALMIVNGMRLMRASKLQARFSKKRIYRRYMLYQIRDEVASLPYDGAGVSNWLRKQETDGLRFPSMLYALLRLHP